MPAPEVSDLWQTAVLWPAIGYDSYGVVTVDDPVEIACRWITGQQVEDGPDALAVVDQAIAVGGRMWLGALADWYGTGSAGDETEVMEVASYKETPDIKDRVSRREVGLRYYKDDPRA